MSQLNEITFGGTDEENAELKKMVTEVVGRLFELLSVNVSVAC